MTKRLLLRNLTCLALAALALYAAAIGWLWFNQERILFYPEPLPANTQLAQAADVHEVMIDVPGAQLSALQLHLPNPRGAVFFLHGNGGNLATWFINTDLYRRANWDLFMLDYRGYGKSTGHIESEAQLRADVRAAFAQIAPQYAGKPVVIYGRSLGTGLAAGLSAELADTGHAPQLTILVSPYRSMAALAAEHYSWVPQAVLRYPLRTEADVPRLRGRLLLVHGDQDPLIPLAHSEALLSVAQKNSVDVSLLVVPGAAHHDVHEFKVYLDGFLAELGRL